MEVKAWTYEEFPAFNEPVEQSERIPTTGDEVGVHYLNDVPYASPDGIPLTLQILIPASRNEGFSFFGGEQPFRKPCFVYVQGSGWGPQYVYAEVTELAKLARRGYVCAVVQYRHAGEAAFPAQIRDARNAVRFLRQNAGRFGIDPARMILAGSSSGGHTALWGGMLHDDSPENLFPGVSAEVCGIVNYFGSTSFLTPDSNPSTPNHCRADSPEGKVMGGRDMIEHPELARQLSVDANIDAATVIPPVLNLHGTKDRTVNCTCSVAVHRKLLETGHPSSLILIEGADHGGPEFWTDRALGIVDGFCRSVFPA